MEVEIESDTPCSSLAVESILRIGTAGALWGLCTGPYDANKLGLTGFARASFVARSMGKIGTQCGFFAGIFAFTRCGIQNYRGQIDVMNSAAAGALAGAAVAAGRTRNRKQVAGMAALLSIVCAAADYSRTY